MKICIIGGGTAGWFAANYINSCQSEHEITVVESSRIGIIGAGEGSTGVFYEMIHKALQIPFEDFLVGTGGTQKLGIRFQNWKGDGRSYIAPLDNTSASNNELWDFDLMIHTLQHGTEQAFSSTVNGVLASQGLSTVHQTTGAVLPRHSYHFDGHQVGQFLKKHLHKKIGNLLSIIDDEVVEIKQDEQGYVRSVKLKSGQCLEADIWVDASGFARIFSKSLDFGWQSFSANLTCNRAIPFLLPHKERIDPLTESIAMNSGWMWQIPTQARRGCGYVFDSNFISEDQAVEEIENKLQQKIEPIKVIKFEPGRYERAFVKNVVSIGLSQSFLEPLQATSIHGTIGILFNMMQFWLRPWGIADDSITDRLNRNVAQAVDHFADLIQIHYRSGRNDTEFWRYTQQLPERPFVEYLRKTAKHRWLNNSDWHQNYGGAGYGVAIYPLIEYGWMKCPQDIYNLISRDKLSTIEKKYQEAITSIQQTARQALSHTELINRIKTTGSVHEPKPSFDMNQLHPLLRT